MNDLLDEVTVPIKIQPEAEAATSSGAIRLSSLNAVKNQARYLLSQRDTTLFDNPIMRVSCELLSLVISVKRLQCPEDMYTFRTGLKGQLTDLKFKIAQLDYPPSVADKTCFLFAVMLDEQILHSEWGEESSWENQTLVSELFGVKNGGEQFYLVAERALLQPVLLKDLLELIYIMIKLGFRGKYRLEGKELLGALLQRLEQAIFVDLDLNGSQRAADIPRPEATKVIKRARPQRPVRLWRSILLFSALIMACWGGVYYWYQLSVEAKAEPFTNLPSFTQQYYSQANVQEKEFIYVSTPEELTGKARVTIDVNPQAAKVTEPPSTRQEETSGASLGWRIQLATLSSQASANNFVSLHGTILPNAQVSQAGNFYIVTSSVASREAAQKVLNDANQAGIDDAFIIKVR